MANSCLSGLKLGYNEAMATLGEARRSSSGHARYVFGSKVVKHYLFGLFSLHIWGYQDEPFTFSLRQNPECLKFASSYFVSYFFFFFLDLACVMDFMADCSDPTASVAVPLVGKP